MNPDFKIPSQPFHRAALLLGSFLAICAVRGQTPDLATIAERLKAVESEVSALRQENTALRRQVGAVETTVAKPAASAAASIRLNGELRLRYENFSSPNAAFVDRNRFRGRLRLGGTAALADNVEVGLRLTTGVSEGEPTGNNATWQDNASKKAFALDLAYAKWTAFKTDDTLLALTGGKMNNPFPADDLILDGDYTPEGFAAQYSRKLDPVHTLRSTGALFVIDELSASSHDPFLVAGQLRLDSTWNKEWSSSFGVTALSVSNSDRLVNSAVPDVHKGNTRTAAGALVNSYHPWLIDAAVTRTIAGIPYKLCGDYMVNPGAATDNHAYYGGLYVGKAAKKGTWEFNYRYRVAQADCWFEELIDSDSGGYYQSAPSGGSIGYGGGTNVRGHIFAANYAVSDYALVGFTYFGTRLIHPVPANSNSRMGRLQVNTILKF